MTVRLNPYAINTQDELIGNQLRLVAKAYVASDDSELCRLFLNGHQGVLQAFGLKPESIQSFIPSWTTRSDVIVCMFFDAFGKPVSGVRMHKKTDRALPFEGALQEVGIDAIDLVKNGDWEICGLWNDVSYSGELLSYLVAEFAMSLLQRWSGSGLVYNFASSHTDFITSPLGFKRTSEEKLVGDIPYPDSRYVTRVLCQTKDGWGTTRLGEYWSDDIGERVFWNGKREIYLRYDLSKIPV